MPQCSTETQSINDDFGQDFKCISFLESRGYTLTKQWNWIKPVPSHTVSVEEKNCIVYLITEWDFDGIIK